MTDALLNLLRLRPALPCAVSANVDAGVGKPLKTAKRKKSWE